MRTTPETELPAAGTEPARVTTGAIWAEGPVWWPRRRAALSSDLPGVPSRDSTSSTFCEVSDGDVSRPLRD